VTVVMTLHWIKAGLAALLVGGGAIATGAAAAPGQPCQQMTVKDTSYSVCTFDMKTTALSLNWKGADGAAYGTVGAAARALGRTGGPVTFAMNAGMYHADNSPVGLYIEGGKELKKANLAGGFGNFHMKPNGVFYFTAEEAGVMETSRFVKARPKTDYATQSGPMLVIEGKLHPKFSANGPSLKVRNGVGVRDGGQTVVFVISDEGVSFGDFGRLFRDHLKCPNALFLDGSISSLWAPSINRADEFWPAGPIVVAKPRK
jgi:uncharacterized protein YigE (DUF2233 family)